jgi:CHAT domain-containing protein
VVSDARPPASLGLPQLRAEPQVGPGSLWLRGAEATPSRVLEALSRASSAELHVHGVVDTAVSEGSFLALSPDGDGRHRLTAAEVAAARLGGRPVIILGACRAAETAGFFHQAYGLPLAFLRAGARAVIAAPVDLPDAEATRFFADVRRRLEAGAEPAIAVRDARRALAAAPSARWVESVLVFE